MIKLMCIQLSLARFDVVVAIISTTGQGDLPANARSFWKKLLRKKLPPDYLKDINITSFGLGDSSYPKYDFRLVLVKVD